MATPVRTSVNSSQGGLPPAGVPGRAPTDAVDCRICGVPNASHREGCFNCGSLLRLEEPETFVVMQRQVVGDDETPGRVVYARVQPRHEGGAPMARF